MHCFHFDLFFGNNQGLMDSIRLVSALAVENELQDSRRRELENSDDNRNETTQGVSGATAPLKCNR
jgi:hypothetical protein